MRWREGERLDNGRERGNGVFRAPPSRRTGHAGSGEKSVDSSEHYNHNVEEMIGEFEFLVLSAAARLGDEAYGAAIRRAIEDATGERCSIGALYTTIDRLESKRLVETFMGEATPQRGGRAKRMVNVTKEGAEAASNFYRAVMRIGGDFSWGTL